MCLSTTLDCWKNICQGSTVVPATATTSRRMPAFSPPGRLGMAPAADVATLAWTKKATGNTTKSRATRPSRKRSQERYDPPAITPKSSTADTSTAITVDRPKYVRACSTPMNSAEIVTALMTNKSPTAKQPQNLPNLAKISLPCPTPETAPSRSTISWQMNRIGN